jgi:3-deoxy-manno-octulosonate cytidylyltransferase (CMP-KDO synthetase)
VAARRRYPAGRIVVNVQGDEPLIEPSLIRRVAANLAGHGDAAMATACHPIVSAREVSNSNIVKVALDHAGYALYFSRAPIPWARDAYASGIRRVPRALPVFRHLGIYAYRAGFLRAFTRLKPAAIERFEALEQLRALAHGYRIHCAIMHATPAPGVDTPADLRRVRRRYR